MLHPSSMIKTNLWLKGHHLLDGQNLMPSYVTNRKEETTNKISLFFTLIAQWSRQKSLLFLCDIRSCVSIEYKSSLNIIFITPCLSFFLNIKSFSCSMINTKYNSATKECYLLVKLIIVRTLKFMWNLLKQNVIHRKKRTNKDFQWFIFHYQFHYCLSCFRDAAFLANFINL